MTDETKHDDGGHAQPGKVCTGHTPMDEHPMYEHPAGMTLLDHFAGLAMQGVSHDR